MRDTLKTVVIALAIYILSATVIPFCSASMADTYLYGPYSNRMEGLAGIPTGGTGIFLQSFMAYREKMNLSNDLVMKIRFYLPSGGHAFISAFGSRRHGRSHYQMRPTLNQWIAGWNVFSPWPARDVLVPLSTTPDAVSPDGIDIVVRVNRDQIGSGDIAPAILYSDSGKLPGIIGKYRLTILPNVSLTFAKFTLIHVNSGQIVFSDEKHNIGAEVPFTFYFDLINQPDGKYRMLVITEEYGRTKGPTRQYFFHHVSRMQ